MNYTKESIENRRRAIEIRRNIITFFTYLIILPIIIYNISLIIISLIKPNETPSFLGIKTYVIISGSMAPNLNIGDVVLIKKCKEEELKVEDIISFREGQSIITHRIIDVVETENGKTYVTKGDNNNVQDSDTVKYENIEGAYIAKIPHLGKLVIFLKNKIVIVSTILIFYLLYAHDLKVSEKERIRRRKRKKFEAEEANKIGKE